ncbi:putative very-long-chain 3-oxoacyl-CoA reductase [Dioscorea sansibarensis]
MFYSHPHVGASSGIGVETSRVLALCGVHVIMGVRNTSAGNAVKEVILNEIPTAKVDVMELDLSSKASVRKFASDFNSAGFAIEHPHVRTNNVGRGNAPFKLSQDGIELTFATNHIGHFLLAELLLDHMKNTAHKSNIEGRIINVASAAYILAYREGIRFDKINDKSGYQCYLSYGQSKLANILHANQLSSILKKQGANVTANSVHPGLIATKIFRHYPILHGIVTILSKCGIKNVQPGAATTCYVALHPQVQGVTGKYFLDSNVAKLVSHAANPEMAKKLWELSLNMISLT